MNGVVMHPTGPGSYRSHDALLQQATQMSPPGFEPGLSRPRHDVLDDEDSDGAPPNLLDHIACVAPTHPCGRAYCHVCIDVYTVTHTPAHRHTCTHTFVHGVAMHLAGQGSYHSNDPPPANYSNVLTRSRTWVVAATTRRPNH